MTCPLSEVKYCWSLPPGITLPRFLCVSLLVIGGALEGISVVISEENITTAPHPMRGFIIQVVAMSIAAQRWAFVQWALQGGSAIKSLSKVELTARMLPYGVFVMLVFSLIVEPAAFDDTDTYVVARACFLSALVAILVVSELRLVQISSAVTFFVCGVLHNIPIILCGVWFFSEEITLLQIAGFGLCVLGTLCYGMVTPIRHKEDDFFEPLDEFVFDEGKMVEIDIEEFQTAADRANENTTNELTLQKDQKSGAPRPRPVVFGATGRPSDNDISTDVSAAQSAGQPSAEKDLEIEDALYIG
eukprot:GEMP01034037.1.p1 GENE.GEMP01034037.1~~GEMP01034037.1.p1  ORF type:complete len:302 (+),score=54.34 GEMP01034037.1:426-1331(+)